MMAAQLNQTVMAVVTTTAAAAANTSDVFRSMKVQTGSKTPYSDATQVSLERLPQVYYFFKNQACGKEFLSLS